MVERTVLGKALNLLPIDHLPSWSSAPPICAAAAHLLRDGFIRAIGARPQAPIAAKARRLHPPLAQNDQGATDCVKSERSRGNLRATVLCAAALLIAPRLDAQKFSSTCFFDP